MQGRMDGQTGVTAGGISTVLSVHSGLLGS